MSSFIPSVTNHIGTTDGGRISVSVDKDSSVKPEQHSSVRSRSSDGDEDTLLKATSIDDTSTFRISDFKRSGKDYIPPPSERDIVRKHTQQVVHSQQGPLIPQGLQGPMVNETRSRSPGPGLKVNMDTGLPKSHSGVPVMSKTRRLVYV